MEENYNTVKRKVINKYFNQEKVCRDIKIIITIIIASLILSFIISQDFHHLDTCKVEHCSVCSIIHIAQAIINLATAIFNCIVANFLIYFFLSRLHKETKIFMQNSLVFQKVQLNE